MIAESLNIPKTALENFSCCTIMHPPTKLYVFANFRPKNVTSFITPILSKFISARLFSVSQVENEVKMTHCVDVADIQEAVTGE
jgi:hypothetical protein